MNYLSSTHLPFAPISIGETHHSHFCFEVVAIFLRLTLDSLAAHSKFVSLARIISFIIRVQSPIQGEGL